MTPQLAPHGPFAVLQAQIDEARARSFPELARAAIGPSLKASTTLALLLEAARTEEHLTASPGLPDPEGWLAAGEDLADYPLLSGKRLADATPDDLEADRRAIAAWMVHRERLVELHRELADRRLAREVHA